MSEKEEETYYCLNRVSLSIVGRVNVKTLVINESLVKTVNYLEAVRSILINSQKNLVIENTSDIGFKFYYEDRLIIFQVSIYEGKIFRLKDSNKIGDPVFDIF